MGKAKQQLQKMAGRSMAELRKMDPRRADLKKMTELDYSILSEAFATLAKPAKRALISNGIRTPADLARFSVDTVAGFHGIGPETVDALLGVLRKQRLKFKSEG